MNDIISFCEVYDILQHLDIKLYRKIPKSFIKFIDENRDKEYKVNIDYCNSINNQNLQRGTRIILSVIYRDYLCSKEKRDKLINNDKIELKSKKEILNEKYSVDNIFKNRKHIIEATKTENVSMLKYKKSLFSKILNKIEKILKRNHR